MTMSVDQKAMQDPPSGFLHEKYKEGVETYSDLGFSYDRYRAHVLEVMGHPDQFPENRRYEDLYLALGLISKNERAYTIYQQWQFPPKPTESTQKNESLTLYRYTEIIATNVIKDRGCDGAIEGAKDVAQDVAVALPEALSKYAGKSSIRSWIYKGAQWRAADWARKNRRKAESFDDEQTSKQVENEFTYTNARATSTVDVIAFTECDEMFIQILPKALARMEKDAIEEIRSAPTGPYHLMNQYLMLDGIFRYQLKKNEIAKMVGVHAANIGRRHDAGVRYLKPILFEIGEQENYVALDIEECIKAFAENRWRYGATITLQFTDGQSEHAIEQNEIEKHVSEDGRSVTVEFKNDQCILRSSDDAHAVQDLTKALRDRYKLRVIKPRKKKKA
jgi:RNA polymerase sigma factor (sigma-70 family)